MKYITVDKRLYGCDSGCEGSIVVILDENKNVVSKGEFDFSYIDDDHDVDLAIDFYLEKHPECANLERLYNVRFYQYEN